MVAGLPMQPFQKNVTDDVSNAALVHQFWIENEMAFSADFAVGSDSGVEGIGDAKLIIGKAG